MTRAKRYANHAGGRKYSEATGKELPRSSTHTDAAEKLAASNVFREVWLRCREHEGYARLKAEFLQEVKEWERDQDGAEQKSEQQTESQRPARRKERTRGSDVG